MSAFFLTGEIIPADAANDHEPVQFDLVLEIDAKLLLANVEVGRQCGVLYVYVVLGDLVVVRIKQIDGGRCGILVDYVRVETEVIQAHQYIVPGRSGLKTSRKLVVHSEAGGSFICKISLPRESPAICGQTRSIGVGLKRFRVGVPEVLQEIPVVVDVVVDLVAGQQHLFIKFVPVGVAGEGILRQLAIGVGQEQTGSGQGGINPHGRIVLVVEVEVDKCVLAHLPIHRRRDHVALLLGGFGLTIPGTGQTHQAVGQVGIAQLTPALNGSFREIAGTTRHLNLVKALSGGLFPDQIHHPARRHGPV